MNSISSRVRLKRTFTARARLTRWRYRYLLPRIVRFGAIWLYLFVIFLVDLEFWEGFNLPIFYAIPVLIVALFEPPRYVATISVLTLCMQVLEVWYERPPSGAWPLTTLALIVVCAIAVWLAEQRQPERERQRTLARTRHATKALRYRVLVLLGYVHLLEIAPTLSPQMQEEILGRVGMEGQELKSILEDLDDKTEP